MNEKKMIRQEVLEKMHLIQDEVRKRRNELMLEKLKNDEDVIRSENIMCFVSFRDEIDTHEFIRWLLKSGKNVFVPVIKDGKMLISRLKAFEELKSGYFGILEPETIRETKADALDLVITPAVVFDSENYRIGYGGGFYDRLFADKALNAKKTGICFREQLVKSVPKDTYDLPVDKVISA